MSATPLGDVIAAVRKHHGLTQKEAAERAKLCKRTWELVEAGTHANVHLDTLGAIATALDCSPWQLMLMTRRQPIVSTTQAIWSTLWLYLAGRERK